MNASIYRISIRCQKNGWEKPDIQTVKCLNPGKKESGDILIVSTVSFWRRLYRGSHCSKEE
jgi:hypothetical protein